MQMKLLSLTLVDRPVHVHRRRFSLKDIGLRGWTCSRSAILKCLSRWCVIAMAFSMCLEGLLMERNDLMDAVWPAVQCIEAAKGHCYYVLGGFKQVLAFFKQRVNLTLVIESRESICRDEVMSGKYDFTPFLAPYPSLHPNITKGVFFSQASRDILTALENHTFRQRVPNYLVYSTDVYFTCLLFFLIWSVSNAFVSSLFHSNRRFGSVVLKSFFLVTTAHMKSINTRSPNKLLQLSLLISVTVGISVNNARFSNENIRIHSPKVYTSYKSLFEDPPDAIFARKHELDSIDQLKFQSSSPEMYLKKLRPKMIDMSEFFKRPRGKGVKIVVLSSTSNVDVKFLRWEIIQRGIKKISVIRKRDPNAEKTFWHAAISASIFDRPGSKKILWTFKVVQEGDLIHGIIRRGKSLILHSKNLSGPSFRKVLFDRHKPPNFEVNRVKDVSIDSFKAILPFFSWLYLSACLTIVVEIALLTQILVPVYRKNRVQSLGRPLAQRIIQKQLSSQSTNE